MITCNTCNESKPTTDYWRDSSRSSGYKGYCKKCKPDRGEYHKQWAKDNADKMREYSRRSKAKPENKLRDKKRTYQTRYGITMEEFEAMVISQGGVCAICKRNALNATGKAFAVDHDHKCCPGKSSCGKCVRGALCQVCNQALGMFGDSQEVLESAIAYLAKSEQRVG